MNRHQRIIAKYLYDISKGIALVAVVGRLLGNEKSIFEIITGLLVSVVLFIFAFLLEKPLKHEPEF